MLELPDDEHSYWRTGLSKPNYLALATDIEADTVVIGGGVCGLTTAYLLKEAGQKVALLEKTTLGSGTTGCTTGKVTSQHGLVYKGLSDRFGETTARVYGQANEAAIGRIEQIITKENIDCGWQRDDNYVYTNDAKRVEEFRAEAETAARFGLPALFETEVSLPFEVKAAVRFKDQAKLDAQRYVLGLSAAVNGQGSYVFESSKAVRIHDGEPCKVATERATITARNIVVATNVPTWPLIARGAYCFLEYPMTSYIVAGRTDDELTGMYISPDKRHYSIFPITFDKERLILIGGCSHIRGPLGKHARYQRLADYAEEYFGASQIVYKWSAWDYLAYDDLPLVGRMYPWSKHLYVATAFKKWGLTNTMVAASILRDLVLGRPSVWAETYDSLRTSPLTSIPRAMAKTVGL